MLKLFNILFVVNEVSVHKIVIVLNFFRGFYPTGSVVSSLVLAKIARMLFHQADQIACHRQKIKITLHFIYLQKQFQNPSGKSL